MSWPNDQRLLKKTTVERRARRGRREFLVFFSVSSVTCSEIWMQTISRRRKRTKKYDVISFHGCAPFMTCGQTALIHWLIRPAGRSGRDCDHVSGDTDRSLTGWYRQSTPKVRRVFWTCAAAWGLDSMDGFVFQVHDSGAGRGARPDAGPGGIHRQRQLLRGRHRRLDRRLAGRPLWPRPCAAGHDPVVLDLLFPLRLRAELPAASGAADLHGFGFGAEWAVGAVLLGELVAPAIAARRSAPCRALPDQVRRWPPCLPARWRRCCRCGWAGAWRSGSACCPRFWCSSCARRATMRTSTSGPRRARSNRAVPFCRGDLQTGAPPPDRAGLPAGAGLAGRRLRGQ